MMWWKETTSFESFTYKPKISVKLLEEELGIRTLQLKHPSFETTFFHVQDYFSLESTFKKEMQHFFKGIEVFGFFDCRNCWYKLIWYLENGDYTWILPKELCREIVSYIPKHLFAQNEEFWNSLELFGLEICGIIKNRKHASFKTRIIKTFKTIESNLNYCKRILYQQKHEKMMKFAIKQYLDDVRYISTFIEHNWNPEKRFYVPQYIKKKLGKVIDEKLKDQSLENSNFKKMENCICICGFAWRNVGQFIGSKGIHAKTVQKKSFVYNIDTNGRRNCEEARILLYGEIDDILFSIQYLNTQWRKKKFRNKFSYPPPDTRSTNVIFIGFENDVLKRLRQFCQKTKIRHFICGSYALLKIDFWKRIGDCIQNLQNNEK